MKKLFVYVLVLLFCCKNKNMEQHTTNLPNLTFVILSNQAVDQYYFILDESEKGHYAPFREVLNSMHDANDLVSIDPAIKTEKLKDKIRLLQSKQAYTKEEIAELLRFKVLIYGKSAGHEINYAMSLPLQNFLYSKGILHMFIHDYSKQEDFFLRNNSTVKYFQIDFFSGVNIGSKISGLNVPDNLSSEFYYFKSILDGFIKREFRLIGVAEKKNFFGLDDSTLTFIKQQERKREDQLRELAEKAAKLRSKQ